MFFFFKFMHLPGELIIHVKNILALLRFELTNKTQNSFFSLALEVTYKKRGGGHEKQL